MTDECRKAFDEILRRWFPSQSYGYNEAVGELIDAMSARGNVWVSVKERLPDYNTFVLGSIRWTSGKIVFMPIYRMADEGDSWQWLTADDNSELVFDVDVTHWQPLPEPPKGDE